MYSVIYEADGDIHQLGPFKTESSADTAAKKAQKDGEFDIRDQKVYLLSPKHKMTEYSMEDLGVKD